MDIAINKPAKDFLKRNFENWYSNEVTKHLYGVSNLESATLQPVDLSMAVLKELSARWLVEMAKYIADNPQFIVNGFTCAGISHALDDSDYTEEDVGEELELLSDEDELKEDYFEADYN